MHCSRGWARDVRRLSPRGTRGRGACRMGGTGVCSSSFDSACDASGWSTRRDHCVAGMSRCCWWPATRGPLSSLPFGSVNALLSSCAEVRKCDFGWYGKLFAREADNLKIANLRRTTCKRFRVAFMKGWSDGRNDWPNRHCHSPIRLDSRHAHRMLLPGSEATPRMSTSWPAAPKLSIMPPWPSDV